VLLRRPDVAWGLPLRVGMKARHNQARDGPSRFDRPIDDPRGRPWRGRPRSAVSRGAGLF